MTNADKIRSMTDEELANMLNMHECGRDCPVGEFDKHKCYMHESCYNCWLDWLKKEADNDN